MTFEVLFTLPHKKLWAYFCCIKWLIHLGQGRVYHVVAQVMHLRAKATFVLWPFLAFFIRTNFQSLWLYIRVPLYSMGRKYVSRLNGGPQEKTVVIVLEILPYDDNIRPKKLRPLLIIFSENWFSEQKSEWHSGCLVKSRFFQK